MIRLAAVGDLHAGLDSAERLRDQFDHLDDQADLLMLAGDLTQCGEPGEARILAEALARHSLPRIAVLGNHDHHGGQPDKVRQTVEAAGVRVLEGESVTLQLDGLRVGVAGVKGFGGGFWGRCGTDFGEPEMKAFVRHTQAIAQRLEAALRGLEADVRIVLLHYAPIPETLEGEPPEIFPFLGSYLLAEAIDRVGAELVLHGHAHRGAESGSTPGGIPVRNVAQPVIKRAYNLYRFDSERLLAGSASLA